MIPAYFFPTTILLVDDDELFIANLASDLSSHSLYQTTSNLQTAAQLLQDSETACARISASETEAVSAADEYLLSVNFSDYYCIPYQAQRFNHISVLVVDYHMPNLTGIELINSLQKNSIKKILLTAASDYNIAVAAFNNGTINKYVNKNASMHTILDAYIAELQHDYFYEKTKTVMEFLATRQPYLTEISYSNLVRHYINLYHIVEYYLLDGMGSYLLIDEQGKRYCLAVRPESQLQYYTDIAIGNEAFDEIVNCLQNRTHLPFFLAQTDREEPVENWAAYLHPAQSVKTMDTILYYSVIENFVIDPKQHILSLFEYKKELG